MGGSVTVASVLGQGSAFHLRFPDVPISARLPASEKFSPDGQVDFNELRPATILVIDDNDTNCQLVAGLFAGTHHRLVFGSSGEEAIIKSRELKPDLLLLDVRMPGMGGYAALEEIRKIPGLEFLPIIAVTASNLMHEENSLKEHFSGYLRKPFSKGELFCRTSPDFLPAKCQTRIPPLAIHGEPCLSSGSSAIAVPAPKELMTRLRQLIIEPWPSPSATVRPSMKAAFLPRGSEGLGQQWQCPPLTDYAGKLLRDAENYGRRPTSKNTWANLPCWSNNSIRPHPK